MENNEMLQTRQCKYCNVIKSIDLFKNGKKCINCNKKWYEENNRKRWQQIKDNPTKLLEYRKKQREFRNKDINKKISRNNRFKDYQNKNPELTMLGNAKVRAKKNGLNFSIELSDVIIPEYCPVLSIKLKKIGVVKTYSSPSLDRIINELGYIKGNVRVISNRANELKNNATVNEIQSIVNYLNGNKIKSELLYNLEWLDKKRKIMWSDAKQRANKDKVAFTINIEDINIPSYCPVLGIKLKHGLGGERLGNSISIDRIVPELGYIPENIEIISFRANNIKRNGSLNEFKLVLNYMQNNSKKYE